MTRPSPLLWLVIALLLLLPTAAGRLLLDIAGGLMIAFLTIPILLTGIGWLGWRAIQAKMITCKQCGVSSFNTGDQCPVCGARRPSNNTSKSQNSIPASATTIDVKAEEAE